MNMSRTLGWKHFCVAAVGVLAVGGVVVWQATNNPSQTKQTRTQTVPDSTVLPDVVTAEFSRMADIYGTAKAEAEVKELQWQNRLEAPALEPVERVPDELETASDIANSTETLPPLDTIRFASQPPTRIWAWYSRMDVGDGPRPLPPSVDSAVRLGPGGVVAAHNGEVCFDAEDMTLPSRGGLGFSFRRYYRSHSDYDGPMGYGWDHNHNLRIVADAPELSAARTLRLFGGSFEIRFDRDGERWAPQRGAFRALDVAPDGTLVVSDSRRRRWVFEPAESPPGGRACWRIRRIQTRHGDEAGNLLTYHYVKGTDVLSWIKDPFGQRIQFYYNGNGRLKLMSSPGRRVEFTYEEGCLVSTVVPNVATSLSHSETNKTTYQYRMVDGRSWCVSRRINESPAQLFLDINLTAGTPGFGRVLEAGYRLLASPSDTVKWTFALSDREGGDVLSVTPPDPEPQVDYSFPEETRFPWLPDQMTIPARVASWRYSYNADGLCLREIDPDGYEILKRYDSDNPDPRTRANCLDERTQASAETIVGPLRAKGQRTEYLAGTSLPTQISHYQIDASGDRKVLLEQRWEYESDTLNVLSSSTGNEATYYFWNPHGQLLAEVDGCGSVTLHYYSAGLPETDMQDALGGDVNGTGLRVRTVGDAPRDHLINTVRPEDRQRAENLPSRTSALPPCSEVAHFLYDRRGHQIGEIGPGHREHSVVNRLGQPLATWNTSDGLAVTEYNRQFRTIRHYRRFSSLRTSIINSDSNYAGLDVRPFHGTFFRQSYEYDPWGHVAAFRPTDEPTRGGNDSPVFRYDRYASGALRRLTNPEGTSRVHLYDDATGLPSATTLEGYDGKAITLREFLKYSPAGRLLSYKDDCGDTWTTSLDSLGREYETRRPGGLTSRTALDGLDRPSRMTATYEGTRVDEQEWTYTDAGQTERIVRGRFRQNGETIAPLGKLVVEASRYDAAGRLIARRSTRSESWSHFFYDGLGRQIAQRTPEDDWKLTLYRDGHPAVTSALLRRPDGRNPAALRQVTIRTDRFHPYVEVPVDDTGTVRWARGVVRAWSPEGRLTETLELQGTHTGFVFDTLGNRIQQETHPARKEDSGQTRRVIMRFDAAGRQVEKTTFVRPLALFYAEAPQDTEALGAAADHLEKINRELAEDEQGLRDHPSFGPWHGRADTIKRCMREISACVRHIRSASLHFNRYGMIGDAEAKRLMEKAQTISGFSGDAKIDAYADEFKSIAGQLETYVSWARSPQVTARRVSVPQTIRWSYDSLGRLVRLDQPDGLRVERKYGDGGSLVHRMTWRHASEPELVLRDIKFQYGAERRLTNLFRPKDDELLQAFSYDVWGQCSKAEDKTGREHTTVHREYDNLGLLWNEHISYGQDVIQDLDVTVRPSSGTAEYRWRKPGAMPEAFWTQASYRQDHAGRVSSLALDGTEYCQWAYQGQIPVSRSVPSSLTRRELSLNAMGEIVGIRVDQRPEGHWAPLSEMQYALGDRGDVVASTVKLEQTARSPGSLASQYYAFDAYRQIVASAQEKAPATPNLQARREELLTVADSTAAVIAQNTHRDEAGNAFASYQGRKADDPVHEALETGLAFSSSAFLDMPDSNSGLPSGPVLEGSTRFKLASNRLAAVAGQGHAQQSYQYDLLGQLTRFAGEYWDGEDRQPVFWSLTFDDLGRMTEMQAVAREDGQREPSQQAEKVATLDFAYDPWNRRIVKTVTDHGTHVTRQEASLYCEGRPTVIMSQHENGSWEPVQQYTWGAMPTEALRAVTSETMAGVGRSRELATYAIHQDRNNSVAFTSELTGGTIRPTPLATYLETGENGSSAVIQDVDSSRPVENPQECINGKVDDAESTRWSADDRDWSWIEIKLAQPRNVTGLTIWTEAFPNDFEVYRMEGEVPLPSSEDVEGWARRRKDEGRLVTKVQDGLFVSSRGLRRKLSSLECPYELRLNAARTNRLLILWSNSSQTPRAVTVKEFGVRALPEMTCSLGQNGSWLDRETGLYYQHHRYRLPTMNGKFVSPDPLGFLAGPDLYAYANNNPLRWQDPDGRIVVRILVGAGFGAALGGGSYLFHCWLTGEEISWSKLAIRTAAGAAAGAVGAATFGAGSAFLKTHYEIEGVANLVLSGAGAGGASGFTHGFSQGSSEAALLDGHSIGDSLLMGLQAGGKGAVVGAVAGAAGGAVGGWLGNLAEKTSALRGFGTALAAGGSAGAAGGGVGGAWTGYQRYGLSLDMLQHAGSGALRGAIYGAAIGGAMYGVGITIDKLGDRTWAKARAETWKSEAGAHPDRWSPENLARMRQGLAPQRVNPITGNLESMELHHAMLPQRSGLPRSLIDSRWNLKKVWPDEHRAVHIRRH